MEHIRRKNEQLVSVVVITYNSSKTIIETLESIRTQTYQNIELIVADDCSIDNTVEIVNAWFNNYKDYFIHTEFILSNKNTGVSANVNRGFSKSGGKWIKPIAGDDKLLPNCISDFIEYVNDNPKSNIIFSKVVGFGNEDAATKWPYLNVKKYFEAFDSEQFRIILSVQNFLPAPSAFIKKNVWESVGGYDEDIPLLEDWPFWIKALTNGFSFDFLDKETVCYRFGDTSISQGIKPLSKSYLESNQKAQAYAIKSLSSISLGYFYFNQTMRLNKKWNNLLSAVIVRLLNLFNPAFYEYKATIRAFMRIREDYPPCI